jgi:hypothetical protein
MVAVLEPVRDDLEYREKESYIGILMESGWNNHSMIGVLVKDAKLWL